MALEPPPLAVQLELQRAEESQAEEEPEWSSCVTYLRLKWGIPIRGDALFAIPNITLVEARPGDVVVFLYGRGADKSHVARLDKITHQGIWVHEYNRIPFTEDYRLVDFNDKALLGFYRPSLDPRLQ